jgi:uncharacterized protein YjiS (DUF1127 family)
MQRTRVPSRACPAPPHSEPLYRSPNVTHSTDAVSNAADRAAAQDPLLLTFGGTVQYRVRALAMRAVRQIRVWRARSRERHFLGMMAERDLYELGLSPMQARHEANKAFWQA